MADTYSDKLKDPRWQKKRLEIFNRDNWACQICGDVKETLSVHHKEYIYGKDPWNYDGPLLITVCETCHQIIENSKKRRPNFDIEMAKACCLSDDDGAVSLYRYAGEQPIFIIKRGDGVKVNRDDARKLTRLLKNIPNGKKIH